MARSGQLQLKTHDNGVAHQRVATVLKAITPELKQRRSRVKGEGGRTPWRRASAASRRLSAPDASAPLTLLSRSAEGGADLAQERAALDPALDRPVDPRGGPLVPGLGALPRALAGRVRGFGGDPTIIPPTPDGHRRDAAPRRRGRRARREGPAGEASRGDRFDHFGDFAGS